MQSSLGGVLRALVMLACIIVVPLFALWGTSLSDLAKRFFDTRAGINAAAAGRPGASAQVAPAGINPVDRGGSTGGLTAGWQPNPPLMARNPASGSGAADSVGGTCSLQGCCPPNMAGGPQPPMARSFPSGTGRLPQIAPGRESALLVNEASDATRPLRPLRRSEGIVPTAFSEPSPLRGTEMGQPAADRALNADAQVSNTSPTSLAMGRPDSTSQTADGVLYIQQRLRALGAVQYRLQAWGTEREYYRFQCRVAIAGDPSAVRYFEAADADSLRAMSRVLQAVESWRSGEID